MITGSHRKAAPTEKLELHCPRCNGLVAVDSDPTGVFVELLCHNCGARSYYDMKAN